MPHVLLKLASGRTDVQKTAIATALTQALIATAGCTEDDVSVAIEDVDPKQWVRAAQVMSTLMTVMAAALLGPVLGGQILAFAGWRAIFWTLVGVGLLTLAALFMLPETLPPARRITERLTAAFSRYGQLVRQPRLLGFAGIAGCFFGGTFAYIAGSPFAYIAYHHLLPQFYGVVFGAGIVGLMALNIVNVRLVLRLGSERMLRAGNWLAAVGGVAVAVDAWTGWAGWPGW